MYITTVGHLDKINSGQGDNWEIFISACIRAP